MSFATNINSDKEEKSMLSQQQQLQQQSQQSSMSASASHGVGRRLEDMLIQSQTTIHGDIVYNNDNDNGNNNDTIEGVVMSNSNSNNNSYSNTEGDADIAIETDGNMKNSEKNGAKKNKQHRHHRSLSGLFSNSAYISSNVNAKGDKSHNKGIFSKKIQNDNVNNKYPSQQLTNQITITIDDPNEEDNNNKDHNDDYEIDQDDINDMNVNVNEADSDSPSRGKKHRRLYSGGVSNPSMAHRRINSGGNTAFIHRNINIDSIIGAVTGNNATSTSSSMSMSTSAGNRSGTGMSTSRSTSTNISTGGSNVTRGVSDTSNVTGSSSATVMNSYNYQQQRSQPLHHQQQQHHQQQHQQQHSSSVNNRTRSLSPRPSPKYYSTEDILRHNHCRDDSGIDNLLSFATTTNKNGNATANFNFNSHSVSNINANTNMNMNTAAVGSNPMNDSNSSMSVAPVAGNVGGIVNEPAAAAQWLQNMRKSPPFDLSPVDYVEHYPSNIGPSGPSGAASAYSHENSHHPYPPPRYFTNRSISNGSSRSASPSQHQGYFAGGNGMNQRYPSPSYHGGAGGERMPSPTESLYHQPQQLPQSQPYPQQYPIQQSQPHRGNKQHHQQYPGQMASSNYYPTKSASSSQQYPYYPLPRTQSRASSSMRSSTSSASSVSSTQQYPIQQQSTGHYPYSQHNRSSYIAASNAARDATLGLPHHPLATGQRARPQRDISSTSIESRIDTDEPLFQKDAILQQQQQEQSKLSSSKQSQHYPPRPTTTQPHYRISPQLFEESLEGHTIRGSPDSLTYNSTYQDTLLSGVDQRLVSTTATTSSSPITQQQEMIQPPLKLPANSQKHHHHRKLSSTTLLNSFVRDMDKPQDQQNIPQQQQQKTNNHQRISSTGTLVLDDSLFGEQFLEPDVMQSMPTNSSSLNTQFISSSPTQSTNAASNMNLVNKKEGVSPQGFNPLGKICTPVTTRKKEKNTSTILKSSASTAGAGAASTKPASTGRKVTGGVSKRVRRKCSFQDCNNRVVQGGLCISHGAKRKICGHPGCTKHVKKAGMCSTHGPARKRCEVEGCPKVSVQGGRCIAHGAKKKLCSVENCSKQAILSGMCKKHHDKEKMRSEASANHLAQYPSGQIMYPPGQYCHAVAKENEGNSPDFSGVGVNRRESGTVSNSSSAAHRRGLSIFQDMSTVDTIIGSSSTSALPSGDTTNTLARSSSAPNASEGVRSRNRHNRGLSIFAEDEVVDKIVLNDIGI